MPTSAPSFLILLHNHNGNVPQGEGISIIQKKLQDRSTVQSDMQAGAASNMRHKLAGSTRIFIARIKRISRFQVATSTTCEKRFKKNRRSSRSVIMWILILVARTTKRKRRWWLTMQVTLRSLQTLKRKIIWRTGRMIMEVSANKIKWLFRSYKKRKEFQGVSKWYDGRAKIEKS